MIQGPQYPFPVIQFALSQTFNIGIKPTTWVYAIGLERYLSKISRNNFENIHFDPIWNKECSNEERPKISKTSKHLSIFQCSVNQVHEPGSVNLENCDQICGEEGSKMFEKWN